MKFYEVIIETGFLKSDLKAVRVVADNAAAAAARAHRRVPGFIQLVIELAK